MCAGVKVRALNLNIIQAKINTKASVNVRVNQAKIKSKLCLKLK